MRIIDDHTHINWYGYSAADVVRNMDEAGIDKAWALTWQELDGGTMRNYAHLSPEDVMAAAARYPDRLVPFCALDPRRERVEDTLRELVGQGCRGYGELKVRLMYDNPDCIRMYDLCAELGLPVLVHIDVPLPGIPFWYGGSIDALERAAHACPRTTFIGHAPGFWREITGTADRSSKLYPGGKVRPGGKIEKLLESCRNVYADLSGGSGLNALTRDPQHAVKFLATYHRKLLFGRDCYNNFLADFLDTLDLPRNVRANIMWRNAARLVPVDW